MIYDKIERLNKYISKEDFTKIKGFLDKISPDMEERKYEIDGERIYAKVESYETRKYEDCKIEAHDKYIDIQCTIKGAEGIGVYRRNLLEVIDEYNPEKDVVHFNIDIAEEVAHTTNTVGYFTMLYPEEAHSPMQKIIGYDRVKKFVIKYKVIE